jgi:hypothetical protein
MNSTVSRVTVAESVFRPPDWQKTVTVLLPHRPFSDKTTKEHEHGFTPARLVDEAGDLKQTPGAIGSGESECQRRPVMPNRPRVMAARTTGAVSTFPFHTIATRRPIPLAVARADFSPPRGFGNTAISSWSVW